MVHKYGLACDFGAILYRCPSFVKYWFYALLRMLILLILLHQNSSNELKNAQFFVVQISAVYERSIRKKRLSEQL